MTQQKPDKNKSKGVFVDCNGIGNPKGTLNKNREHELKEEKNRIFDKCDKGIPIINKDIERVWDIDNELKGIQEERERILKLIEFEKKLNCTKREMSLLKVIEYKIKEQEISEGEKTE